MIRTWIVSMMEAKMDARSVNRKITTLRTFYKFLVRMGVLQRTPMLKVIAPKTDKKLPEYIDQTRMEKLSEMPEGDDFVEFRNWFLVDFLYRTGIRRSELIGLTLEEVNLRAKVITVTGKRNKVRQVPLTDSFVEEINRYLKLREKYQLEQGGSGSYFFVGDDGNQITIGYVYRTVKAAVSLVSTGKKRSPHILRHSFATALLNNGADINAIKELLGHSSLAATQVYTHNSIEKLREVYRRAFPKA